MQSEINLNNLNNIMLQLVIVCFITCMYLFARAGIHATACILRSEDNLWKSALSDHRGSREWTEVMRLGGKHLDSLNHSYGLICFILSLRFMVIWFSTGHCPLGVGWSRGTTYRRATEWARDWFLEQKWNLSLFPQRPKQFVITEHRRPLLM